MPSESIVVPHEDGAATSEQLACYANAHLSTANNPYLVSVIWWDAQSNFFVDFFGTDKPKTQEMSERESHLGNVCRIRQKEQNSFKPRSVRPSIWPENAGQTYRRHSKAGEHGYSSAPEASGEVPLAATLAEHVRQLGEVDGTPVDGTLSALQSLIDSGHTLPPMPLLLAGSWGRIGFSLHIPDYSKMKKAELKQNCKDPGLKYGGIRKLY